MTGLLEEVERLYGILGVEAVTCFRIIALVPLPELGREERLERGGGTVSQRFNVVFGAYTEPGSQDRERRRRIFAGGTNHIRTPYVSAQGF